MVIKQLLPVVGSAIVLAIIGALSQWAQQAWLAPSLGSAILVQTFTPQEPNAKPWNIGAGQLLGLAGGFIGVYLMSARRLPMFTGDHALVFPRVWAVANAILVAAGLQVLLKAENPAGGATAILVAIGAEAADWSGAARLIVGILLVTVLGEITRKLILRSQDPNN